MKTYIFTASKTGENVDFETTIQAKAEPDFWGCYELAASHGCEFWTCEEAGA